MKPKYTPLSWKVLVWVAILGATQLHAQGLHRFHQGNSLTGPLINDADGSGGVIHALAVDAGFVEDAQWMVKNAGIPIDAIFNKRHNPTMEDDIKSILREFKPFPVVCVQPYGHQHKRRPETEASAAAFIFDQALQHTPDARLFIYYNWVSYDASEGEFATAKWRKRTLESHRDHFDPIVDYLRQEFPQKRIYVLPVGQALLALSDRIEAGKVPGVASTAELFDLPTKKGGNRTVHPHARGYYLSGLVHFFSYYHDQLKSKPGEKDWRDLRHDLTVGMPYAVPPNTFVNLTDEQAAVFQEVAWNIVRTTPRTVVTDSDSTQRNSTRTDFTPPIAPGNLRITKRNGSAVTVSWNPSKDEGGAGLLRYVAYLDGRDKRDTRQTSFTFEDLVPDRQYQVEIRAFDGEFNFSRARLTVPRRKE